MKKNELEKKNANDLHKTLQEKRESLRDFRFSEQGSRTRNVREGRATRKTIARILTELRSRVASNAKSE